MTYKAGPRTERVKVADTTLQWLDDDESVPFVFNNVNVLLFAGVFSDC